MTTHEHSHDHAHQHSHDHSVGEGQDVRQMFTREFWDERYAASDRVWSGEPNPALVEHATPLAPGTALDVACGEGADAVWLARQGWRVTGVDVSRVALDRAAAHAEDAGVADRTAWQLVDVVAGAPLPQADLVSVQFLHVPDEDFAAVYTALAAAVLPGGSLLVGAHHPAEAGTGLRNPELSHLLFGPDQVVALLPADAWDVRVAAARPREVDRDGRTTTATDTVVHAVRRHG